MDGRGSLKASAGVVSSEFADEFVVVNPGTGQAHTLSGDAALVWRSVQNGVYPDIADAQVDLVVAGLVELGLLETGGVSRRTVLKAGAAGGASLALLGITSMGLPTAAMAASTYNTVTFSGYGTYYLFMPADGSPVDFTLAGAGGGGDRNGGIGGNGASVTGTISNNTTVPAILTVYIGAGGGSGGSGGGSGLPGGAGGDGGAAGDSYTFGGAGGGGASAMLASDDTILVVAAGGGGSGYGQHGDAGSSPIATSLPTQNNPNSNGQSGNISDPGGGGGGGGGEPSGNGGGGGFAVSAGTGGTSYYDPSTAGTLTVTLGNFSPGGGGGGGITFTGSDGSARFTGYSITQTT